MVDVFLAGRPWSSYYCVIPECSAVSAQSNRQVSLPAIASLDLSLFITKLIGLIRLPSTKIQMHFNLH